MNYFVLHQDVPYCEFRLYCINTIHIIEFLKLASQLQFFLL